jgi:hypothetical protein
MRKSNAMKSVLARVENLAKKEYRDMVGQLEAMLAVYEKQTGVTSKRPYTKKELATTEAKPPEKVVQLKPLASKSEPVQLSLLEPKPRKVRSDKGGTHKKWAKPKPAKTPKLSPSHCKAISLGKKLASARKKLAQAGITL